jgi:hypothetical protein
MVAFSRDMPIPYGINQRLQRAITMSTRFWDAGCPPESFSKI